MHGKFQSYVKSIKLVNFRNYEKAELESCGRSVVLLGENGAGKTNLLEAVSLLSKGPGIRNASAECMQYSGSTTPWFVNYKAVGREEVFSVDIARKSNKRSVSVDGKAALYNTLHNILCMVWLIPQHDHILLKAPTERLRFFDRVVHIFDKDYSSNMVKYEKAKRDRKRILQEAPHHDHWLTSLESIMSTCGINIARTRGCVLETLHSTLSAHATGADFFKFSIRLESQVSGILRPSMDDGIDTYAECLRNSRKTDAARNCTTFGVHNDNFQIIHEPKNMVASNCSTGEQKILLLSLLLTAAIAKSKSDGQAPVMLLDDVMSHLDAQHKEELVEILQDLGCQTWMTDVDVKNFKGFQESFQYFHIAHGQISKISP